MKDLAKYIIISLLCIALGFFIFKSCDDQPVKEIVKIETDTLTVLDTIFVKDTVKVTHIKARYDTIYFESKPVQIAKADTTINNDSIKVKVDYYFEPLNYFNIEVEMLKEKVIEKIKKIKETITVELKPRFYEEQSFWWAVGTTLLLLINLIWG